MNNIPDYCIICGCWCSDWCYDCSLFPGDVFLSLYLT